MSAVPFRAALACLLFGLLSAAHAQYKVVGPDGKVTYTDQPPAAAAARVQSLPAGGSGSSNQGLPLELRRVADRYPVTLYAAKGCAPCDTGRQLLISRGIPFTEKRVDTPADINAFIAANSVGTIPTLTIGQQRLKGLVTTEWQSYLDAAGYPKTSALPASYRNPDPSPLVSPSAAPAPAASPQPAAPEPERSAPANPPGTPNIRF
jgi:glutaredoxin